MTDKDFSQYDLGGVLRSAHEDANQALRTTSANTSVPPKYSRVDLTYNTDGSVTNATFYKGELAETRSVTFVADVAGSLNNTYWTLYSENDESLYHVWYNVSGGGTDPAPAGSTGIEIPIETNDAKEIVKLATERVLECFSDFEVQECAPYVLRVRNSRKGPATDSIDSGTGFTITTVQQGSEKLIKSVDVPYDGKSIYIFNTQEKRFENHPKTTITADLSGPNVIEMINQTIPLANTEVTLALPDDTKRVTIRSRGDVAVLRIAFAAGETTTKYETIDRGFIWDTFDVDLPNSTIFYLQANKVGSVIEVKVWRKV